ncbi:hypothetical protein ACCS66_03895 [Rhizobium ruizarguesonis]
MSVTDEMEDEPSDNTPWNRSFKFIVPERGDIAPADCDGENGILTMIDERLDPAPYTLFPGWADSTFSSKPLNDESSAAKALQQSMEATSECIGAMEAAGLGEQAAKVEVPDGWTYELRGQGNPDLPSLLDHFELMVRSSSLHHDPAKSFREIHDARIAIFEKFAKADEQNRDIARQAIGKAVNVIHTHARRFLTPMSLREHNFLRSVIQEEVERVVGGVL